MSNVLVYGITWFVLHINSGTNESQIGPADAPKFQTVVWIGLSVGLFCSFLFHLNVKEDSDYSGTNVRASQLRTSVSDILRNVEIYQVLLYLSMVNFT
jgi:hypothetical protein